MQARGVVDGSKWSDANVRSPLERCVWHHEVIYVLHAFQKKTQKTAKVDLDLAARRYKLIGG